MNKPNVPRSSGTELRSFPDTPSFPVRQLVVDTVPAPPFGIMLKIPLPKWADVMVVCVNTGGGLVPVDVCLPHQLYVDGVEKILAQYPDARWITCVPSRSGSYVDVWMRDVISAGPSANTSTPTGEESSQARQQKSTVSELENAK